MAGADATLEAIGRPRGMNAPAVGDAVARAGRRIRSVLAEAPPPWPWLIAALQHRLGAVTTEDLLGDALAALGAAPGSRAACFAAWLAGPFRPVRGRPGWLAREPGVLLARSAQCVRADGGVRRLADVADELADLGLTPATLVPWLRAFGATVVHDLVVATAGSLADVVERVLDAHGRSRSVGQIAEDLAAGGRLVDEAALAAAVRARRFRTTGDGAVRLAAWGEAASHPRAERATPSRSTVARPAETGRCAPPAGERAAARCPPGDVGSLGRSPGERVWLSVQVDDALLRGVEAAVPVELVERLGLEPGARRTFSCRWGPVTLAHDGSRPTSGSLRAVARAVGARRGDRLLFGFSAAGDVQVDVRESARSEPAAGTATGEAGERGPRLRDAGGARVPTAAAAGELGRDQTVSAQTTGRGVR